MKLPQSIFSFELWGNLAHFKKYYTTLSPLTFSIPPGTAIRGMLGAVLGLPKSDAPETFLSTYIGVQVINPISKLTLQINNVMVKSREHFSRYEAHSQTNYEFLRDPHYRIFVASEDVNTHSELAKRLGERDCAYTLSLGITEALANFGNFETHTVARVGTVTDTIRTIIPRHRMQATSKTFSDNHIFAEKVPIRMLNSREVTQYEEFLFDSTGQGVHARLENAVTLDDGSIIAMI